jgi:hypothetical protein
MDARMVDPIARFYRARRLASTVAADEAGVK